MVISHTKKGKVLSTEREDSKAEGKRQSRIGECLNGGRNGCGQGTERLWWMGGCEH